MVSFSSACDRPKGDGHVIRWKTERRNELALDESVSRARDGVGDVLGARAWVQHLRGAAGFVSKERMSRAFGKTNLKTIALATGFGAASSSCSYAAAAAGRSAIQQGAAIIPALAFMFASTNLVIELGVVLWILDGLAFCARGIRRRICLDRACWINGAILYAEKCSG